MSQRNQLLVNDEIYHVFNRSVGHESIFIDKRNKLRVLTLFDYYRFKTPMRFSYFIRLNSQLKKTILKNLYDSNPLIAIFAFAIMPNHYHLLVKQLVKDGIVNTISNVQNSYAKFFNTKNKRNGSLFCERFKATRIESNEQFIHVSRYIHLNPVTSYLIQVKDLEEYPYTSFPHYMQKMNYSFIQKNAILNHFKNMQSYREFVYNWADYQRKLAVIKHIQIGR